MIILILAFVVFVVVTLMIRRILENSPYWDSKTNRFYKHAKDSENPNHASCPKCSTRSRLIRTTTNPHYTGVYCEHCGEVWFDL